MSLDVTKTLELTDKEQGMFADFMQWVNNYNEYIINSWADKVSSHDDEDDGIIVDGLVDIEVEEVA